MSNDNANAELIRAVRAGNLEGVVAALNAGANPDCPDDHGGVGLPLRLACFHGFNAIVGELIRRGADANAANAEGPGAAIRMAVRGKQKDTVRLLLEFGANLPAGLQTGLTLAEVLAAQGVAKKRAEMHAAVAASVPSAGSAPHSPFGDLVVEEVELRGCYGVDTAILDADMLRMAAAGTLPPDQKPAEGEEALAPALEFNKFKFWKK